MELTVEYSIVFAYSNSEILFNVDQFKPRINVLNYKRLFAVDEKEHFTLSYNVSSYPAPNITWWRSKMGEKYELITRCLASSQNCDLVKHGNKENITKTSFTIKDVRFPEDSFFYRLNARNDMGNDSKTFQIQVLGKTNDVNSYYILACGMKF